MSTALTPAVSEIAAELGHELANLQRAGADALTAQADLERILTEAVGKYSSEDANLVVLGSLARQEWLDYISDLDWTYLVDGQAKSLHLTIVQEIKRTLEKQVRSVNGNTQKRFGEPGPTGTFGNMVFSHQVIHLIGGHDDTNRNTSQRILLLLESVPIGNRSAYDRVVRGIIDRYLEEEAHLLVEDGNRFKVPRFLLNDIVRFWRTMAVDFASKQRDRGGQGWGLRNAKLRMSRKLIFASGLLICFSCHLDADLQSKISTENDAVNRRHLANFIWEHVRLTPLQILAKGARTYGLDRERYAAMFAAYDEFMAIMADPISRAALKKLTAKESRDNQVFGRIREVSQQFQDGLSGLFFDNLGTLTRKYGVF